MTIGFEKYSNGSQQIMLAGPGYFLSTSDAKTIGVGALVLEEKQHHFSKM